MENIELKIDYWSRNKNSAGEAEKELRCPGCKGQTQVVKGKTVRHFVIDSLLNKIKANNYNICLDEICDVVYFNQNIILNKYDIKIPIYFKKDSDPQYICYCNNVTKEQIVDAVIDKGAHNMKDIIRITGAMKNGECETKNPLGKCCRPLIEEVINKTLNKQNKIDNNIKTKEWYKWKKRQI